MPHQNRSQKWGRCQYCSKERGEDRERERRGSKSSTEEHCLNTVMLDRFTLTYKRYRRLHRFFILHFAKGNDESIRSITSTPQTLPSAAQFKTLNFMSSTSLTLREINHS